MPDVLVAGGGLAGLAAAAALSSAGLSVDVLESRAFLGGRATSFPLAPSDPESEVIDNCQHVLLRCCTNLLDFYRRLGVEREIEFHRQFYFVEPGGRVSTLERGSLPSPLHFAGSFLSMPCFDWADKVSIGRALLALGDEAITRTDLDRITMGDWLREKRQTPRAVERFWRQVLVSAVNEELDVMAAAHGFQVFEKGFLGNADAYEMGVPAAPLGELYSARVWERFPHVRLRFRQPLEAIELDGDRIGGFIAGGERLTATHYVSALPLDRLAAIAPGLGLDASWYEHSPITGIHLWFDRPVTALPHATLLDRTMQWMFNKSDGRYVQLVVSASRSLLEMPRAEVIDLAVRELGEFFPAAREAKLERAQVIKEARATFSARPGLEAKRPVAKTRFANLTLAGDWTRSGWPATMEGAVRSGYLAAEAVTGRPFLR